MSEQPIWIRRSTVLRLTGLSKEAVGKLIAAGSLTPKYFPGMARAYFDRAQVEGLRPSERDSHGRTDNQQQREERYKR